MHARPSLTLRITPPRFRHGGMALLALMLILGCQTESPTSPAPSPGGGSVPGKGIAGLVMAPPAMQKNGGAWDNVRGPLNEAPLVGVEVRLLGAKGEALEVAAVKTDDKGIFRFDSVPVEAGLVSIMPPAVEANKPLLAYYHQGKASYVGVTSTIVAGALKESLRRNTALTFASFDADKVAELQAQVETKVSAPTNVISLYYLDQILITWARADQTLKAPLEALSPGITTIPSPTPPPSIK